MSVCVCVCVCVCVLVHGVRVSICVYVFVCVFVLRSVIQSVGCVRAVRAQCADMLDDLVFTRQMTCKNIFCRFLFFVDASCLLGALGTRIS